MKKIEINRTDDPTSIAFKVCTAVDREGGTIVLTGGSAASFYAPHAYQSLDVDFCIYVSMGGQEIDQALSDLGFKGRLGQYGHDNTSVTVDFVGEDILVGNDVITDFDRYGWEDSLLNVLTATDSVRDRLAAFYWWDDTDALEVAKAITGKHEVDLEFVRAWSEREGESERFEEFLTQLGV